MQKVEVSCDGCGADLTTRSNSVDYRLVLASESKPGHGSGAYTDMMIYPPIDRAYHFCGLACLDHWRGREKHRDGLWREWHNQWTAEHGTAHEGGMISYPCVPEDVRKARAAEIDAAALAAFPMSKPNPRSRSTRG